MFDINSKVVCVDDTFLPSQRLHAYYENFPIKGQIYTVRDIIPAQGYKGEHTIAILLEEIVNPSNEIKGRGEFGFAAYRLRELDENSDHSFNQEKEPTTSQA